MNLPASFINDIRSLLGDGEFENFAAALRETPPASIRMNRDKPLCGGGRAESRERVPWAAHGYYLDERLTFTFDPLFHAGVYYVQEASSMFVGQALRQYVTKPVVMLDLCAAPGGKSTHARSVLPEGSLLVSNEVIRNRSQVLAENLTKWGHPDVVVTNNDPADFSALPHFFDVILADVPCSGEGMFRKDAAAVDEWSPENVEICRQRQQRIVADIWPCLKPGGLLVYSTCTYNIKEDEENVRWIRRELGAESLPLDICPEWGITGNLLPGDEAPVFRFLPHRTKGEGLFLAVLRKPAEEAESDRHFFPQAKAKKKEKKGAATGASLVSKENLTTAARC
ncbi:tRNA and rRNA cytosine-C5-methylases [Bacteroides pyogenes JCM 10003]|nr:tRNA and rRNA cytosine-C5-methylases [Bacteroides pyogenes JCM 10003]